MRLDLTRPDLHRATIMAMLADYQLEMDGQTLIVKAFGNWTIEQAGQLDGRLSLDVGKLTYSIVNYDMSEIEDLDTSGAYLLALSLIHI